MAPFFVRRAAKVALRREKGGEVDIGAKSASIPCAESALRTTSIFHSAMKSSEACCNWQPPQDLKCRQGGATRAEEGVTIFTSFSFSPSRFAVMISPGRVKGAKYGPSAIPSPK